MFRTRLLVNTCVLLGALLAAGCATSTQPLSDEKTSVPDLRLLGTWEFQQEEGKDKATVTIVQMQDSPNVLQATSNDGEKEQTTTILTTKIGDTCVASIAGKDDEGNVIYTIGKYALAPDDSLELHGLDTDFFAAAVEHKELKGTVKQEMFKDVKLDDTSENLRAFLAKYGDKCFTSEGVLHVTHVKKP